MAAVESSVSQMCISSWFSSSFESDAQQLSKQKASTVMEVSVFNQMPSICI